MMYGAVLAMALAIPPGAQALVDGAIADAAQRFGVQARAVDVQRVNWPDASLGCPQQGMHYPQRVVGGWLVVLAAGERRFEYHAGTQGAAFPCPADRAQKPLPDTSM